MVKSLSRFALKYGLIPAVYSLIRLYFFLIRVRSVDEERIMQYLNQGGKAIAAIWHQRIFLVLTYARRFGEFAPAVMISQSRDGDIIAEVFRPLNFRPVRGSSSRGGRKALAAIIADLAVNSCAVHVVDGPRTPAGCHQGRACQHGPVLGRSDLARFHLHESPVDLETLGPLPHPETIQHGCRPLGRAGSRSADIG